MLDDGPRPPRAPWLIRGSFRVYRRTPPIYNVVPHDSLTARLNRDRPPRPNGDDLSAHVLLLEIRVRIGAIVIILRE